MTHGINARCRPGSRKLPDTDREEECAIFWPGCRSTGAIQLDHALVRGTPLESDAF